MNYLLDRMHEKSSFKGVIYVLASIAMYFSPDNIDDIIESLLAGLGSIEIITKEEKNEK